MAIRLVIILMFSLFGRALMFSVPDKWLMSLAFVVAGMLMLLTAGSNMAKARSNMMTKMGINKYHGIKKTVDYPDLIFGTTELFAVLDMLAAIVLVVGGYYITAIPFFLISILSALMREHFMTIEIPSRKIFENAMQEMKDFSENDENVDVIEVSGNVDEALSEIGEHIKAQIKKIEEQESGNG